MIFYISHKLLDTFKVVHIPVCNVSASRELCFWFIGTQLYLGQNSFCSSGPHGADVITWLCVTLGTGIFCGLLQPVQYEQITVVQSRAHTRRARALTSVKWAVLGTFMCLLRVEGSGQQAEQQRDGRSRLPAVLIICSISAVIPAWGTSRPPFCPSPSSVMLHYESSQQPAPSSCCYLNAR